MRWEEPHDGRGEPLVERAPEKPSRKWDIMFGGSGARPPPEDEGVQGAAGAGRRAGGERGEGEAS